MLRSGEIGPSFNARSGDAAVQAQKLAALHADESDESLVEQLRPLMLRRGVKASEVLALLEDPTGEMLETYERARRLVDLASRGTVE